MFQAYRDWKDLGVPDPGSGGPSLLGLSPRVKLLGGMAPVSK